MARGSIFPRTLGDEKTKRYEAVIRLSNGKQQLRTFSKKRDAEDYLDKHSSDMRDGNFREVRKATFDQYSDHWQQTHLTQHNVKATTLNSYLAIRYEFPSQEL